MNSFPNVAIFAFGSAVLIPLLTLIVHVALAIAVYNDATNQLQQDGLYFVGARMWGIITLAGGILSAAIYWAMHHSTLRRT